MSFYRLFLVVLILFVIGINSTIAKEPMKDVEAPGDWVGNDVFYWPYVSERIEIKCTGSMKPTFDCKHELFVYNTTRKNIELLFRLKVGDIVGFNNSQYVHRVIFIGYDNDGKYFITKGDNNEYTDLWGHGKLRVNDISYIVVGVRY